MAEFRKRVQRSSNAYPSLIQPSVAERISWKSLAGVPLASLSEQPLSSLRQCFHKRRAKCSRRTIYPAVPSELESYAGSKVGGTGAYRLTVDAQGAVTQVTILKGFTVATVYDERFSNVKGNTVPVLDKVMVQALMRWRAKPGPMRVVDIHWSFGTLPWVNYGKSNGSQ